MPSHKLVAATVRVQLEAGQASPGKVGQALGAYGINLMAFIYDDRSLDLQLKTPPTSALPARAAGLARGGGRPGADAPVAKLERAQLREIARAKLQDLNTGNVDAAERIVAGTASSMGIEVVEA